MKSRTLIASASIVIAAVGCAATPDGAAPTPPQELTYRTGSNIPIRDKAPLTQEEKDRQAKDVSEVQQRILWGNGSRPGK